ncbi:MAG: Re/Si-specific NAD(P)(+) transhydrogenase subunit alpha [Alphaproteobacteria bacterium]|jgi:NAD(P) transhydrogenase subunit alpha
MKVGVLKERMSHEKRVAVSPDTVKSLVSLGFDVFIETNAGILAGINDQHYKEAGAKITKNIADTVDDADIILKVQPSPKTTSKKENETTLLKKGALVIGMLSPHNNTELFEEYTKKNITSFSLELLPRITRAQSMDVLSSQSNLSGYRAVIDAAYEYGKVFPMMMTAAGTASPARVLVIGAGVAGLQAVATAKRLGAIVSVFDVRTAAKEQVESLGAAFIEVKTESQQNLETKGGYAQEASAEYKKKQADLIAETIKKQNIVITTALIPGKEAPKLINAEMVKSMSWGSIIVDLAAVNGGNCALTVPNEITEHNGVKIIGYTNYPSRIPSDASKLYARNLLNFITLLYNKEEKKINLNFDDEIINSCIITHDSKVINKAILK